MNDLLSLTDDGLVERFLAGDEGAFSELSRRYADAVHGTIRRLVRDRHLALDLTQDVFFKLFRSLPQYRPEGRFRSFLFALALNCTRDAMRSRKRKKILFIDDYRQSPQRATRDDHVEQFAQRRAIEEALAQVGPPFREAVYLRDVLGLSYEELAQSMRCTLGTAKSRVNRGRLAFTELYQRLTGSADQAVNERI
ncbi:MAG: RNA polymerase sigma factor [Planctomycetota bacterium]